MEWQAVEIITTSSNYVFTPVIAGTLFKLRHINQSLIKSNLKIAIRQAFEDNGNLALFDYKLINCKVEQDILLFSLPQGLTSRKLAFKRVDDLTDDWKIEIQTFVNDAVIDMPSYPSDPSSFIFNGATKIADEHPITVSNVNAVLLSATDFKKIGSTITNKSTSNLYISLGAVTSFINYDKILGTNEVFETPFNWCGEIYGIWDAPDILEPNNIARVKDFRFLTGVAN